MKEKKVISYIKIKGARENNLKNIDLEIPRNQLVVITGVSGSGKSSLAFDTIYAEGYRKYIDSLSTKAKSILNQVPRPDVDFIEGLSPVIALEQRNLSASNPRSTIASVTEIADYARVLWASLGTAYCPKDGGEVIKQSLDDCLNRIFKEKIGSRLMILSPYMNLKSSVLLGEISRLEQKGYQRLRVNGKIKNIFDKDIVPKGKKEVTLDIVIDRVVLGKDQRSRIADSLELAFSESSNKAIILVESGTIWKELKISMDNACVKCGEIYPEITSKLFSWNNPEGACPDCGGTGETMQFRPELCVPDGSLSVKNGALKPWRIGSRQMIIRRNSLLKQLSEQLPFDRDMPWQELPKNVKDVILYGSKDVKFNFKFRSKSKKENLIPFIGVISDLKATVLNTSSDYLRTRLLSYQISRKCNSCDGTRLNLYSRNILINENSITDFFAMSLDNAIKFLDRIKNYNHKKIEEVLLGLKSRISFLNKVGLNYLDLNRSYNTLSGGEAQRVRLATQLGMSLVGITYVLDEPSIGLHVIDNKKLINTLKDLRDIGNSILVVEHDREMMYESDHMIEIGPGAGSMGGGLIFEGNPRSSHDSKTSLTGDYIINKVNILKNARTLKPKNRYLEIINAYENNLKNISVSFPIGLMSVVCGVSGSGKSTLVNDVLAKHASFRLNKSKEIPGKHETIKGLDYFDRVIRVDQDPIGRSPRSNPATFIKLFDLLRELFAKCPISKIRGYKKGRFSFNMKGGRCERCKGDGLIKLDMQFLSNIYSICSSCNGKRFNRETLDVLFKGYSISDVLEMTVDKACEVFSNQPKIFQKLKTLTDVGLGYLKLGQSSTTLSGGEAQRIKLSLELSKNNRGNNLYILDEPTTGLHWLDVQKLLDLLFELRDSGNTIIIIEHDKDVINLSDWIVELGPKGGSSGGKLLFQGVTSDFFLDTKTPTQSIFS